MTETAEQNARMAATFFIVMVVLADKFGWKRLPMWVRDKNDLRVGVRASADDVGCCDEEKKIERGDVEQVLICSRDQAQWPQGSMVVEPNRASHEVYWMSVQARNTTKGWLHSDARISTADSSCHGGDRTVCATRMVSVGYLCGLRHRSALRLASTTI